MNLLACKLSGLFKLSLGSSSCSGILSRIIPLCWQFKSTCRLFSLVGTMIRLDPQFCCFFYVRSIVQSVSLPSCCVKNSTLMLWHYGLCLSPFSFRFSTSDALVSSAGTTHCIPPKMKVFGIMCNKRCKCLGWCLRKGVLRHLGIHTVWTNKITDEGKQIIIDV